MKGTIRMNIDPARGLLRVDVDGFVDMAGVRGYRADRKAAIAALGAAPNRHISLYDVSLMTIQSQEVMIAFKTVVDDRALASCRLVFVTGGSAVGMQIRRIVKGRDAVACFHGLAEAEAWLFDDESARAAAA